jgi:hypothetical protein
MIIFMEVFSREIGLKSKAEDAPSLLGIKTIKDPFML